jgi:hypothetical protein
MQPNIFIFLTPGTQPNIPLWLHKITFFSDAQEKTMDSCQYSRSATDAMDLLSKRPLTEPAKGKRHRSPSQERPVIGKRLFGTSGFCRQAEQDFILGFPVIEWDSDTGDDTCNSSDSEGGDEEQALSHASAKLQVSSVRPRRNSHPQAIVESGRGFRLVRSKAFLSNLSLMDPIFPSFEHHNGRLNV